MSIEKTKNGDSRNLQGIVGGTLSSVQFVMSYLILGFDSQGALTTLVWPEITIGKEHYHFGDTDYRNELCELIGKVVQTAQVTEREEIVITLENETQLLIPLRKASNPGERAIFAGPKHALYVW
ncbi:MAG TPA: hypothetical protein VFW45_06915 [Candidatus Polarisedimenticolia bacterium]|nr:hypothetical protein [Candidatus Polarisedimenticolia bacterium]